ALGRGSFENIGRQYVAVQGEPTYEINLKGYLKSSPVSDLIFARRFTSQYFQKIHALKRSKILNESDVRILVSENQADFYIDICHPIEAAIATSLQRTYESDSFEYFAGLYERDSFRSTKEVS
ncbi:hypothetical protein ACFL4G_11225, partial [Thermodesulfobacteriota bacterium]